MATKYSTYTFPALTPLAILMAIMCYQRISLICKVALAMSITYIALTFTIAIPQTNKASSPAISQYISQYINDKAIIVQGSGRYRVSPTYYSNHEVYKLIGSNEVAPDPSTISWNAKEVMPFISVNNLPTDKDVYLLIYGNDSFPTTLNQSQWTKIYSTTEGSIYQLHHSLKN